MDLHAKAHHYGIETEFFDAQGQRRFLAPETLEALAQFLQPLPHHAIVTEPLIVRDGDPCLPRFATGALAPFAWTVTRDGPAGAEQIASGPADHGPFAPAISLADDVYRLTLADARGAGDEVPLIVGPRRTFAGAFERVWVLTLQLYSLRSETNWGIGDFGDLVTMLRIAAHAGAAGIGLNPLHALFDDHAADCSPYSPNSRLFLNPLYIDVSRAPGYSDAASVERAELVAALRLTYQVDYRAVAELKWSALRTAFADFSANGAAAERREFEQFRQDRGRTLWLFACFEFLRRRFSGPWWEWPEQWRAPDDELLEQVRNGPDRSEIGYFEYLQWVADRQLRQCRDIAAELGMPIGLYLDVAVGVKADGFDAWNTQVAISRHLSVGAPPDLLNTAGQDWGLSSYTAAGLEATLFRPFRDMLAAVMRYAGAIRLDHVLGLQRIYLIPSAGSPREGAYVRMPFEALLAVTAIESQRHRCVVVGEDLGTVPEDFPARLSDYGVWSYRVMLFERDHGGSFLPPDHYASDALVTFSTHDLPTFAGWSTNHDLAVKRGLGLDPGETDEQRRWAQDRFDAAVEAGGSREFAQAIGFLARTPSRILAIAMEDLQNVADQPNVPGTIDQHPNWRRKLPISVEAFAADLDAARLHALLSERWSPREGLQQLRPT